MRRKRRKSGRQPQASAPRSRHRDDWKQVARIEHTKYCVMLGPIDRLLRSVAPRITGGRVERLRGHRIIRWRDQCCQSVASELLMRNWLTRKCVPSIARKPAVFEFLKMAFRYANGFRQTR